MEIYQIQIALKDFKPKIWRRVLVPADMLLSNFHCVIQTSMGWTNSHLHQFIKNRQYYQERHPDDDYWEEFNNVDYQDIMLSELLTREKERITYEYDFGDGWRHEIILEKILPADKKMHYPVCIKGKNCCPPEDCGGVWGYENMLNILKNPDDEEYDSYKEWLGEEFDPKEFDMDTVNVFLKTEDFGCFDPLR